MILQAAQRVRTTAGGVGVRILSSPDHRSLFGSAALIGLITIVVKLVTLGRDVLMASRFGTSDANDAYITAWVIPGFLTAILTSGFSASIIPIQVETRAKQGEARERAVVGETIAISVASFLILTVVLAVGITGIKPLVAHGYSDAKFELTAHLAIIMIPAVLITGLISLWSSLLNARTRFGLVAAAPVTVPLLSAGLLLVMPGVGIEWLAATFVIGTAAQGAVLFLGLHREGVRLAPAWHGLLPETRRLLRQFGVICANAVVVAGVPVVDTAMAATLGAGSQSTLTYANKLIMPALGISSVALGTAVLPYFSRLVANEDWTGLRHTLATYTRLILVVSIPATVALILLSETLVRVLFERGQFTARDTSAVARVLATYALLIPIQTLAVMLSRVLLSLQIGKAMVISSIAIFLSNIVSDYVLKELMGVEGIALATVLNQVLSLIFLVWMWRRLQRTRMGRA